MKSTILGLLVVATALVAAGCSSSNAEPSGYSKDDFSKRPPPAGYGPPGSKPAAPPTGK